jgi:hypothetical protein
VAVGLGAFDESLGNHFELFLRGDHAAAPIGLAERDLAQSAVGCRDLAHLLDIPLEALPRIGLVQSAFRQISELVHSVLEDGRGSSSLLANRR